MRVLLILSSLFLVSGVLAGCAGPQEAALEPLLLPMPEEPVDPTDVVARQTVMQFLQDTKAPVSSTYDIGRFDLNGDGRREAFVLFKTPYGYWCSFHGCTMLILEAHNESFTLLGDVQPLRAPLYVSSTATNGWKDLIVHISGRWTETKDVALQFDGANYPRNPDVIPACLRYASNSYTPIFYR